MSTDDGAVTLTLPPGAVTTSRQITVRRIADAADDDNALPGTRYEFGPDGLEFDVPVTLELAYSVDDLRPDVTPEEAPHEVVIVRDEGDGFLVQPSTNDLAAGVVTAELGGFSAYHASASATFRLAPTQLRVTAQTASTIELTWNLPSPIPELAAGIGTFPDNHLFRIERAVGSQFPEQADDRFVTVALAGPYSRSQIATGPLSYTDVGLSPQVDDRVPGTGPQSFFTYRVRPTDGVVFGLASDPATGFITPTPGPDADGTNILVDAGFEDETYRPGPVPSGAGYWQGDLATVVTGGQPDGVSPGEGSRMLRCVATGPGGGGTFVGCEIFQAVDVSSLAAPIDSTLVLASASMWVNRVQLDAETDTQFWVTLYALSGSPSDAPDQWSSPLDSWEHRGESDGDTATWEEVGVTNRPLPAGTRTLLLRILSAENVFNDPASDEFDGHYMDDVALTLIRR